MKMSGVFKFYQNGELIGEAENSLTQVGRILAIKTLMGAIPSFGTSIGVGVGEAANTMSGNLATNYRLDFKVASTPVIGTNIDNDLNYDVLLFKGKLEDSLAYKIYEVGLFSDPLLIGGTGYKDELILGFENADNLALTNGTFLTDDSYADTTNIFLTGVTHQTYGQLFRIGRRALVLNSSSAVITTNGFSGLDQYDDLDKLTLAFYATGTATVTVKFYTGTAFRSYSFPATSSGYKVVSVDIGSSTSGQDSGGTEAFDWNNITKIQINRSSGTAAVVLDGLKIENVNLLDVNRGMVSRAVLPSGSPIVKLSNIPVDIEYSLRIGFNGWN